MTTTMNCVELNNKEMDMVNGGKCDPGYDALEQMDLLDIVRPTGGWTDTYYDTYRGNGVWKNVGCEDMIRYVERTLGSNDPRYKALKEYYETCSTHYNGRLILA